MFPAEILVYLLGRGLLSTRDTHEVSSALVRLDPPSLLLTTLRQLAFHSRKALQPGIQQSMTQPVLTSLPHFLMSHTQV